LLLIEHQPVQGYPCIITTSRLLHSETRSIIGNKCSLLNPSPSMERSVYVTILLTSLCS
jgi:hypothetical protein